ncbi:MAG: hypothetical protein KJ077_02820 [Anaerolineae bacterium]|nr:hypothetical protein [Anaerolineae bacterium]
MNGTELKTIEKQSHQQPHDGMVALAQQLERHHVQPAPGTNPPLPQPFPALLWQGLGGGILIGALLGLLFGVALYQGMLIIPGWEGLFSLGPFTFHVFWTMMGVALGLLLGGVGTMD